MRRGHPSSEQKWLQAFADFGYIVVMPGQLHLPKGSAVRAIMLLTQRLLSYDVPSKLLLLSLVFGVSLKL